MLASEKYYQFRHVCCAETGPARNFQEDAAKDMLLHLSECKFPLNDFETGLVRLMQKEPTNKNTAIQLIVATGSTFVITVH